MNDEERHIKAARVFYVDETMLLSDPEQFLKIMSNFIIVKADFLYHCRSFKYIGCSEIFELKEDNEITPEYNIVVDGDNIKAVRLGKAMFWDECH